ncbi:hypothetical protein CG399_08525, partial [Bifidobacteriaceae bacterium NR015]
LNDRLFDRHMSLEITDAAKNLLAQKGFDPLLGARPLRRVIQRDIEDTISEKILLGELSDGEHIKVDAEGEGLLGEFTIKGEKFETIDTTAVVATEDNKSEDNKSEDNKSEDNKSEDSEKESSTAKEDITAKKDSNKK